MSYLQWIFVLIFSSLICNFWQSAQKKRNDSQLQLPGGHVHQKCICIMLNHLCDSREKSCAMIFFSFLRCSSLLSQMRMKFMALMTCLFNLSTAHVFRDQSTFHVQENKSSYGINKNKKYRGQNNHFFCGPLFLCARSKKNQFSSGIWVKMKSKPLGWKN